MDKLDHVLDVRAVQLRQQQSHLCIYSRINNYNTKIYYHWHSTNVVTNMFKNADAYRRCCQQASFCSAWVCLPFRWAREQLARTGRSLAVTCARSRRSWCWPTSFRCSRWTSAGSSSAPDLQRSQNVRL